MDIILGGKKVAYVNIHGRGKPPEINAALCNAASGRESLAADIQYYRCSNCWADTWCAGTCRRRSQQQCTVPCTWFCMGSCAGFGVPIAKYFGAGDQKKMRDCVFNGAALTALIAVILTITCSLLCNSILHILSVPSDIYADAYRYLIVIFLGIPFTLMYNYLSSILRSVGDSRTPFLFLAFSAGLNIFLDLFCIIVLHWGCMGAAIATVTAQAVSAVLCLLFIKKKCRFYGWKRKIGSCRGIQVRSF